jgi:hypothetical protein
MPLIACLVAAIGFLALSPAPDAGVTEDSPSWSCVHDGNRVCGPNNGNGVTPGCYDGYGVMADPWPCRPL